jgi:excisionase family DNA binding protein
MIPSLTIELRLPDEQIQALAALIARNVGGARAEPYTVAEAAHRTGQSEKTIRRHIDAGRLSRIPHIHKTLIPASALERYIHGGDQAA